MVSVNLYSENSKELERFLNTITSKGTRKAYEANINLFLKYKGIDNLEDFKKLTMDDEHQALVQEAREKLGLKLCSISQAIKLGRQCNGFRWTRTDNPTPTI